MDKSVYLILGASSDVGEAFLRKLNEENKDNLIVAHFSGNRKKLEELQAELTNLKMILVQADLGDENQVKKLIHEVKGLESVPTHIVHLAALPFQYMRIKQWDTQRVKQEMMVSFFSFTQVCSEFLPLMAKQKYGKVLVMLSSYTMGTPPKFMADYIAVKYALLGFMKAAAIEYADKGLNINAISPNMMKTSFLEQIDPKTIELNASLSVMKRNATTQESAEGMAFLLSDAATYMNGVNLNLSGGDKM